MDCAPRPRRTRRTEEAWWRQVPDPAHGAVSQPSPAPVRRPGRAASPPLAAPAARLADAHQARHGAGRSRRWRSWCSPGCRPRAGRAGHRAERLRRAGRHRPADHRRWCTSCSRNATAPPVSWPSCVRAGWSSRPARARPRCSRCTPASTRPAWQLRRRPRRWPTRTPSWRVAYSRALEAYDQVLDIRAAVPPAVLSADDRPRQLPPGGRGAARRCSPSRRPGPTSRSSPTRCCATSSSPGSRRSPPGSAASSTPPPAPAGTDSRTRSSWPTCGPSSSPRSARSGSAATTSRSRRYDRPSPRTPAFAAPAEAGGEQRSPPAARAAGAAEPDAVVGGQPAAAGAAAPGGGRRCSTTRSRQADEPAAPRSCGAPCWSSAGSCAVLLAALLTSVRHRPVDRPLAADAAQPGAAGRPDRAAGGPGAAAHRRTAACRDDRRAAGGGPVARTRSARWPRRSSRCTAARSASRWSRPTMRRNVNAMFVNLARRSQVLVERQLELLDELEREESDPDQLENLFKLDHLAARMRRNDESLLVLAGSESTRRWSRPVALAAVHAGRGRRDRAVPAGPARAGGRRCTSSGTPSATWCTCSPSCWRTPPRSPGPDTVGAGRPARAEGGRCADRDRRRGPRDEPDGAGTRRTRCWPTRRPRTSRPSERMGLFVVSHLAARQGVRVRLHGRGAAAWWPVVAAAGGSAAPRPAGRGAGRGRRARGCCRRRRRGAGGPRAGRGGRVGSARCRAELPVAGGAGAGRRPAAPRAVPARAAGRARRRPRGGRTAGPAPGGREPASGWWSPASGPAAPAVARGGPAPPRVPVTGGHQRSGDCRCGCRWRSCPR